MNKKQSLFHIAKRDTLPWYKSFAIRGCAILLALVVCAVVTMLLTGENPVNIFATIFKGAFGSARKSWVTFQNLAVLLGISLAVTPAFKMRFWNIGAEGQVLIGCLATAACMICLADKLPNAVLILVSLAAALTAGALWGFLPAFFKAKWNTNETLFTLMMNYIATQLAAFFIIVWEVPKGAGKIGIINQGTEAGWLPVVGGQKYLLVILVVAVLTVFMYIYLNYSKHGYEIAVVGESQRTASYAGIKVERVIVRTMVLSGAVCGLMGLLLTAGTDHTLTTTIVGGMYQEKGLMPTAKMAGLMAAAILLMALPLGVPLTFAPGRFFLIHSTARIKSSPYPLCSSIPVAIASTFGSKIIS